MSYIDEERLDNIDNEELRKIIEQFIKITGIIRDECEKRNIAFIQGAYFRQSDKISDMDGYFLTNHTKFYPYDGVMFQKRISENFVSCFFDGSISEDD